MITDIYIVCNDSSQEKQVRDSVKSPLTFHFIDSKKGSKEARTLKSHWAARLEPFALVMNKDKPIKAFYSEAEDVINNLIKYLNGETY